MRLYHHPMSSNSRRAVMTATHLKTKLDHRNIQRWFRAVQELEAWKETGK